VFTGVSGITALSPCLSWAHEADRLAFAYYEDGEYNVYAVDNPARSNGSRTGTRTPPITRCSPRNAARSLAGAGRGRRDGDRRYAAPRGTSVYRSSPDSGLRQRAADPDSGLDRARLGEEPHRLVARLPDTSEFTFKAYHTRFSPDYVARPRSATNG